MDRKFIVILVIVILAIAGLFIFTNKNNNTTSNASTTTASVSNHTEGDLSSKVHLVEYGDFQCPACGAFYPIVTQVLSQYLSQIQYSFMEFPLESLHPNALAAARAAEAAGLQGKFFPMYELLYENQNSWVNLNDPSTYFDQLATSIGLNLNKFKTDSASEAVNNTIEADIQAGTKLNIQGTPTFFLNGKMLNNQNIDTVSSFSSVIKQAIQATTTTKTS